MKLLADFFLLLILLEYLIIILKPSQWYCSWKVAPGKKAISRWGGPQSCHLLLTCSSFKERCLDDFKEILLPGPFSNNSLPMDPLCDEGFCDCFVPRREGSEQLFVKDVPCFFFFFKDIFGATHDSEVALSPLLQK